jgi:hypothetical protein
LLSIGEEIKVRKAEEVKKVSFKLKSGKKPTSSECG